MVKIGRQTFTDPPKLSNPFAKYIESVGSSRSKLILPSSSSSPRGQVVTPFQTATSPTSPPSQSSPSAAIVPSPDPVGVNTGSSFDLAGARGEYEKCKSSDEKLKLKARLQPMIVDRLHRLSKMESVSNVGIEIAELVDFLKLMNPSDPNFTEFGHISHTSREGVIRLHEGTLRIKESQEKLQSELAKLSLPSAD